MQDSYQAWLRRRKYALPDEETRLLKLSLARSRGSSQKRLADNDEGAPTSSYAISNMYLPRGSLRPLPLALRATILDFISVVDEMYAKDIDEMANVVAQDDVTILNNVATEAMLLDAGRGLSSSPREASDLFCDASRGSASPVGVGHSSVASPQRRATHPLLAVLAHVERELQATYEERIMGELRTYAACLGIATPSDGLVPDQPPRGPTAATVGSGVQRGVSFRRGSSLAPTSISPRGIAQHGADSASATPSHEHTPSASLLLTRRPSMASLQQQTAAGGGLLDAPQPQPQPRHSYYQRDWFLNRIRAIRLCIRQQRHRFDRALSWVSFREKMLQSTCVALRATVREDLGAWEDILTQWRMPNSSVLPAPGSGIAVGGASGGAAPTATAPSPHAVDILFDMALGELKRYQARTSSVEYLGNPDLSLDDVRNLFWEVHRTRPSEAEVSASYAQSLTFRQAMSLGITEIPWVRGYSWEERVPPAELCDAVDDAASVQLGLRSGGGGGGQSPPTHAGSRSVASVARSERMQQLLGTFCGMDDAMRRQCEELESERMLMETHAEAQRQRAFAVAADGMSQRLWLSTQLYQPRTDHKFRGCEVCNATPIAMVGLHRDNAGVCDDIVLCEACYQALYAEEGSIPNRMYQWYVVRDLIGATTVGHCATDDGGGATPLMPSGMGVA